MTDRNKILLFFAWGKRNAGDHALTLGALELLSSFVDQRDIIVVARYPNCNDPISPVEDIKRYFPDVSVVPPPFDLSSRTGVAKLGQLISSLLICLLTLVLPRIVLRFSGKNSVWRAMSSARVVLLNGGNLFYWHHVRRSTSRLAALAFPLVLAKRLGIPYVLLPQTCGPFEGRRASRWIGWLFENAAFISFRDSDSQRQADLIARLPAEKQALIPDLAFFLPCRKHVFLDERTHPESPEDRDFFCVCLRVAPLGEDVDITIDNPSQTEKVILSVLPDTIVGFQRRTGTHCRVVVQVDHDRPVSERLLDALRARSADCSIIELFDPYSFVSLYKDARFLLSFRLHSMIFALGQGTPVIGVWRRVLGTKIPSLMHDLKMDDFALEISTMTSSLLLEKMCLLDKMWGDIRTNLLKILETKRSNGRDLLRRAINTHSLND